MIFVHLQSIKFLFLNVTHFETQHLHTNIIDWSIEILSYWMFGTFKADNKQTKMEQTDFKKGFTRSWNLLFMYSSLKSTDLIFWQLLKASSEQHYRCFWLMLIWSLLRPQLISSLHYKKHLVCFCTRVYTLEVKLYRETDAHLFFRTRSKSC